MFYLLGVELSEAAQILKVLLSSGPGVGVLVIVCVVYIKHYGIPFTKKNGDNGNKVVSLSCPYKDEIKDLHLIATRQDTPINVIGQAKSDRARLKRIESHGRVAAQEQMNARRVQQENSRATHEADGGKKLHYANMKTGEFPVPDSLKNIDE